MLFLVENFGSCCENIKSIRQKSFDQFGSVPGFQIRGSDKFQTNFGAFVTFLYVILILMSLSFYTQLVLDKSSPDIQTNIYDTQQETPIDFKEEGINWVFSIWKHDSLQQMGFAEFQENFSLYAAKMGYETENNEIKLPQRPVQQPIPIVPCEDAVDSYQYPTSNKLSTFSGICLNYDEIKTKPNIYGIEEIVNIRLFKCQEKSEDIAAGITKCKNNIDLQKITQLTYRLEKSFNLDNYKTPVSYTFSADTRYALEENLKPTVFVYYQKQIIKTNTGPLGKSEHLNSYVTYRNSVYTYETRSPANIVGNYVSTGKLFMQDALWQMTIIPSKTNKVMTRSYFTLMEMFSDIGGIFECLSVATFFQYSFYNIYRINRYIIQKVILGKPNTVPDKYNIKKEFTQLTCRKHCSCCFKKSTKNPILNDKLKVFDSCQQTIAEKMDLGNYLNDSMKFHITYHLLLKSRHVLLAPLLSLHLSVMKKKPGTEYKNTFMKNMHERTDQPVFSVEDAINQIKRHTIGNPTEK